MDLRVVALVLCVAVASVNGAIPKCCLSISRMIPYKILVKVERIDIQHNHGACEINAIVLYANGKQYCAGPRVMKILRDLQYKSRMIRNSSNIK